MPELTWKLVTLICIGMASFGMWALSDMPRWAMAETKMIASTGAHRLYVPVLVSIDLTTGMAFYLKPDAMEWTPFAEQVPCDPVPWYKTTNYFRWAVLAAICGLIFGMATNYARG